MDENKQRIAIAEACGWKTEYNTSVEDDVMYSPDGRIFKSWTHRSGQRRRKKATLLDVTPNYLTDLNAMHEAEKTLNSALRIDYLEEVSALTGSYGASLYATAAQRAEAFLKTLNLWEE